MALLDNGESCSDSVYCGSQFQGKGNLLSKYEIQHPQLFRSLGVFKEICRKYYTNLEEGDMIGQSPYLGFTHVKMKDIFQIDEIREDIPRMTMLYDYDEEILILKFIMGVTHESFAAILSSHFRDAVRERIGSQYSLRQIKSSCMKGPNKMKEPDDAFKPSSRILERDWPSITFEVVVFERLSQLQQDARFWLECSGGQTRIVIIASINKRARSVTIQRWQDAPLAQPAPRRQPAQNTNVPNPYARSAVPTLMQSLTLEEGQIYGGAPLLIPANLLYDVLPLALGAPLGPNDIEITAQILSSLNDFFWSGVN